MDEQQVVVIKVGGNELDQPGFLPAVAETIAALQEQQPCILVHGGGQAINKLLDLLEIKPIFVDGQRVTDESTLEVAEMVLSGSVNKSLVMALQSAGVEALGVSGVDRHLLQVEPWSASLGYVGRIRSVRTELLKQWVFEGVMPVISPISTGPQGRYNVNADHAAGAIAGHLHAGRVVFISNVPGVLVEGQLIPQLTQQEAQDYSDQGIISGGMIPKVSAALEALALGAGEAVITNLAGLQAGRGTRFQ
jgi:acetylglutamate kinase